MDWLSFLFGIIDLPDFSFTSRKPPFLPIIACADCPLLHMIIWTSFLFSLQVMDGIMKSHSILIFFYWDHPWLPFILQINLVGASTTA